MIKKTIEYVDYNGTERSEDFYFNLTEAECIDLEIGTSGGYTEMIRRMVNAKDLAALIKVFREFISNAYGVKSPDGRRFMKSPEILAEFTETEAFSKLYMELATNAEEAAAFVNGVLPNRKVEPPLAIAPRQMDKENNSERESIYASANYTRF